MSRFFPPIVFLMSVVFLGAADSEDRIRIRAEQIRALGIEVGTARPRPLVPSLRLPGRVTLANERNRLVTARSSGVLVHPAVAVGDSITQGQVLAHIESPAFVLLQREYLEARSRFDLASSTALREKQLSEEGIVAGRRAVESAAVLRESHARLRERRQALRLSGMNGEELGELARTRLLRTTQKLRAPFSGVVLEQYAQAGERLDAGGPIYRIGDLDSLRVDVHTPLDIARSIVIGTRLSLPDQGKGVTGRVVAIGSEVHTLDQGVLVRGEMERGAKSLRPGQFVQVQFEVPRRRETAFVVPATAIVHIGARAWIFEQVAQGFKPVTVEVIGGAGSEVVIVGAITKETPLAMRGTATLKAQWLARGGPE